MAVEILRPHDALSDRYRVQTTPFHRRRVITENVNLKQHRRRSNASAAEAKRSSADLRRKADVSVTGGGGLVMGKVTLLRRGEPLSAIASKIDGGNPSEPIGKPIAADLKQIRLDAAAAADIYAGSAFSMSPSPRSVPLPSFFNKHSSNDGATRDLRRLLRLE